MANIDFTDKRTLLKYAPGNRTKKKLKPGRMVLAVVIAAGAFLSVFSLAARTMLPGSGGQTPAGGSPSEKEMAYRQLLERAARKRALLYENWLTASGAAERRQTLAAASSLFSDTLLRDVIPSWYGTGYDFNGATDTPGVGSISCGHFVTTALRDAGLRLERIALAQLPSEEIIRSLAAASSIRRYSGLSGEEFLAALGDLDPGLYLLGLDKHIGFLSIESSGGSPAAFFIHSTLLSPASVVREPAASSHALMTSAYRVLGNLSADRSLLEKWLTQAKIATRGGSD